MKCLHKQQRRRPPLLQHTIACIVLLTSCTREGSKEWALNEIRKYRDTTEMSLEVQGEHVQAITSALGSEQGIDALAATYRSTRDDGFKERLLYVSWALSYDTRSEERVRLTAFLQSALEEESNDRLRSWAAAGLVQAAAPGMEAVFRDMFASELPALWNHGARGLWRIGSTNAVTALIVETRTRRTNSDFVATLKKMVMQDSNQWTTVVSQTLNAD